MRNLLPLFVTLSISYPAISAQVCRDVFQENSKFRQVILTEETATQKRYRENFENDFSVKAQKNWETQILKELKDIENDSSEGVEKIAMLKRFGFIFSEGKITAPSYYDLVRNYLVQAKKGSTAKDIILPSIVLIKDDPKGLQAREYLLITPGIDPFPKEEGYRILFSEEMFNIPFRDALAWFQKGHFPLLDATHDIYHFVSFALHPEYATQMYRAVKNLHPEKYPRFFSRRWFYILEYLTLANPNKKEDLSELLELPKKIKSKRPIPYAKYVEYFQDQSIEKVVKHAEKLIKELPALLVDYGGGTARSNEKFRNINEDLTSAVNTRDSYATALLHHLGTYREDLESIRYNVMGIPHVQVLEKMMELRKLPEDQLRDVANRNMYLAKYFLKNPNDPNSPFVSTYKDRFDLLIRRHVAQLEFYAWATATHLTVDVWIKEGLQLHVPSDSSLSQFTKDIFRDQSPLPRAFDQTPP
ncbi:MAG: hypothetical protein AABY64_04630 [Bdellovibrionota bacterium]